MEAAAVFQAFCGNRDARNHQGKIISDGIHILRNIIRNLIIRPGTRPVVSEIIVNQCGNNRMLAAYLSGKITEELKESYPGLAVSNELPTTMSNAVGLTGNKFIMIIDEWDAPIRENPAVQQEYLEFLRMLFKGSGTTAKIFAAAYMTGILPIKKDGKQSALSYAGRY